MTVLMPIIRLSQGQYLIGAEPKLCKLKASLIMVRIGGGFEPLDIYLRKNGRAHCLRLQQMMEEQMTSLKETIFTLLKKYEASESAVKEFNRKFTRREEQLFIEIV